MEDAKGDRGAIAVVVDDADATAKSTGARVRKPNVVDSEIVGIEEPAVLEATSDHLWFEVSRDGSTWIPLFDNGATPARVEVGGLSASAAQAHVLSEDQIALLSAWPWIRLQILNASDAAVQQSGGDRTFRFIMRERAR